MAQSVQQSEDSVTVTYTVKDKEEQVTADYLLVTVGRKPNTEDLGLDIAGVKVDEKD